MSVCYTASNRLRRVRIRFHLSQIIYFILHHRIGKQMLMHPQFNYLLLVDEGAKNTKRLGDNENEITIWKVASNLLEQICKNQIVIDVKWARSNSNSNGIRFVM